MKSMKFIFFITGIAMVCAGQGTYLIDSGETEYVYGYVDFSTNALVMGDVTSGNGLVITNGAGVAAAEAYFGWSAASSNNFVTVDNDASLGVWGALVLGLASSDNTLEILGGSSVYAGMDTLVGYLQTADDNTVMVSGSGSALVTEGNLYVGHFGSGNTLSVLEGAMAVSDNGYVGVNSNANDNAVLIAGSGSVWTNNGRLLIGHTQSTGNSVTVTNGGSVAAYEGLMIEGSGNEFNLDRGGSLTVHTDFDAAMTGFNFNEGARLYVGGVLSNAPAAIEGERTLGLTGANAWWDMSGSNIAVGAVSSGNALHVEDGGLVEANDVLIGSGASVTGNTVVVAGDGALFDLAGSLAIGSVSNSGNLVEVSSGGTIVLGGDLLIAGSNNTFNLADGGWLTMSNGFDVSTPGFNFLAGGTLESMGALTGMDPSIEDGRTILLNGSNAVWNLGTNLLQVGYASSSNGLYVMNGAYLSSGDAMIGSAGTTGSLIYVSDAVWSNSGALALDGYYNDLVVAGEGYVAVANSLTVMNQSAISFASGGHASASSYYQDASSVFSFDTVTNTPSVPALLEVDSTAEFEGGATVEYTGTISGLERGIIFTNRLVSAGTLVVNGVTNATDSDLDALTIAGLGSLLSIDLTTENDDLLALITRMRLADSAGFADGTDMAGVSDEIDQLADDGNPLADNMLNTLSLLSSAEQNTQLSQLYDRHAPTYAHTKGMLDGFRQARTRGVMPSSMLPGGAFGPHFYSSQLQGWIKGYGSWGQRDNDGSFSGYDQSTYGVVVGVDKSYGDLLAGLAGGAATSDISQDDSDSSKATTGYGLFYASWGTVSWFGDFNFGYGRSSIKDSSGTAFDTSAEYDADQLGFYLGGGKEMVFRNDRLFVTPSAALSGSYYLQESYVESSTTAVPRRVDEYDYFSLQSELGLKVCYTRDLRRSALVPELHANWLHEFNADEQRIGYSLVGGSGSYRFGMPAPVEDLYEVGTGLAWWMYNRDTKAYEWFAGIDGRIGDGYTEAIVSLRLLGQF